MSAASNSRLLQQFVDDKRELLANLDRNDNGNLGDLADYQTTVHLSFASWSGCVQIKLRLCIVDNF